jgi:hypothetical protein
MRFQMSVEVVCPLVRTLANSTLMYSRRNCYGRFRLAMVGAECRVKENCHAKVVFHCGIDVGAPLSSRFQAGQKWKSEA